MFRPIVIAILPLTALAAVGCQKPEADPEPRPTPNMSASPASILREMPDPVVEGPTGPFTATIPFGDASAELPDGAEATIASALASDQFKAGGGIVLRGHSDSVGSDEVNLKSSRRRAEMVADALREAGVDEDRITIIALGEMRPIAPNAHLDGTPDEKGRLKNRRVDIEVLLPAAPDPSDDATPAPGPEETAATP
ncbi:OmpA family protein [Croceicoccus sp. BE223]|uniref:OmpA family protein n=1 Tax=Croceicoccus sp. BE223 TaxID=2817716 RepID=UPI002861FF44|nr:OmpA family protein [Croceicoccus sp. BE223]MDR7103189.1 OOP family OmpA-OmpF porin [Croceicoccus sp. BE223]